MPAADARPAATATEPDPMIELAMRAPQSLVEPLSETLMDELGACSVSIEDDDADTEDEQALFGEPGVPVPAAGWQRSLVRALFEHMSTAEQAAAAVLAAHGQAVELRALQAVADQDWVRATQAQFQPVEVCEGFWIVPSWHAPPPDARIAIRLDPGLAFGTGTHPTTRMCLRWVARHVGAGSDRVLDYGCGSGILAIAAAKLGAGPVLGVDIDENALSAAQDNAATNEVDLALRHSRASLEETFDCVVANILTNPLCVLAPLLAARVAPGGRLALSGVLESQAGQVIAAYAPFIALRPGATFDGWVRLEGEKPAAGAPRP